MASPVGSMVPPPPYSVRRRKDAIHREMALLVNIKKEKLRLADMKKMQLLLSIPAVCLWAILSACFHCALDIFGPSTSQFLYWLLCCSVLQATAAVLALLFSGRRRRTLLAYAAVATTTAGHCVYGRSQWLLLAAYTGDGSIISSVVLAIVFLVCDLFCFLLLIVVGVTDEVMR